MWILAVTKALSSHKVRYAIVGGYAVSLHGAVRGTIDIDIVIPLELNQYNKAEAALKSLGLESNLPVSAEEVFNFRDEYINNRNLIAWTFTSPKNPTQIVDIIITEDSNQFKTTKVKIQRQSANIASIEDLIRMKSDTGRKQDQADIEALRRLK